MLLPFHYYIFIRSGIEAGEMDAIIKKTPIMLQNDPGQTVDDISISASVPYAILNRRNTTIY